MTSNQVKRFCLSVFVVSVTIAMTVAFSTPPPDEAGACADLKDLVETATI